MEKESVLQEIIRILSGISIIILLLGVIVLGIQYIDYKNKFVENDKLEIIQQNCLYYGFTKVNLVDLNDEKIVSCMDYNEVYYRRNDWR